MTATTPGPATPSPDTSPVEGRAGADIKRIVIFVSAGLIGAIVLLFVIALIVALTSNLEQSSAVIRVIRDLVIIFLALEGIVIVMALAILVLQLAKLINLIQTEVKPILENTQTTVNTAKGTVEFVSQNALQPIMRVSGFLAGSSVLLREVMGLRRALRRAPKAEERDAS